MKTFICFVNFLIICSSASQIFAQWQQLNVPTPDPDDPIISVLDLGDKLIVGTYGGTFKSTDEGLTWSSLTNNGIPESALIARFALLGNTIVAVNIRRFGGVYRSVDRGENWEPSNTGLGNDSEYVRTVYAYNQNFFLGVGLYNTVSSAVYYSNDGASWGLRNNGITGTEKGTVQFASVGQNLFASVDYLTGGYLYSSVDEGENWTTINPSGLGHPEFMVGKSPYLIAYFYDVYRSSTFLPFDSSWVLIENGLPDAWYNSIDADLDNIYLAVEENGVYKSSNNGDSWVEMNDGLPSGAEVAVVYRGANYLYAGTVEHNLLRYPLNPSGISEETFSVSDFYLNQNFPNPFNPSTVISFSVPVKSYTSLKIYDVLGNQVATLVNEEKSAGSYEVDFNASGLTSGIYLYKLQVGGFVKTKKMILLK